MQVAKGIFRIVSPHVGCLGCAASVSALAGANFAISGRHKQELCNNVTNHTCMYISCPVAYSICQRVMMHVLIAVEEAITALLEFKVTSRNFLRIARICLVFMTNRVEYRTLFGRVGNKDSTSMSVNAGRLAGFGAGLAIYLGWRGFFILHESNKRRQQRPKPKPGMIS